ncbi:proline-rich protein 36-like [Ursus maritimus]|uniref:Proline-rich protein 36-like n=1 Tax=Ursus maritimus TaxID=29073 RepID=A0A8M1FQ05_URSMA|nr:proline-rich protein 36-like [Ursus maritimus]
MVPLLSSLPQPLILGVPSAARTPQRPLAVASAPSGGRSQILFRRGARAAPLTWDSGCGTSGSLLAKQQDGGPGGTRQKAQPVRGTGRCESLTTTLQTPSTGLHAAPLPSLSSVPSLWHPLHAPQLPGTLFTHCPSQSLLTSPRPQRPVFPPSEPLLTPVAAPAFPPPAAPCPRSTPHRPRGLVDLLSAPPQATRLPPGHGAPPQQPPPASYPRCPLRCPHSSAPARCRQRPERGSVPDSLPAGCPGRAPYLGLRVRDERLAPGKTAGRRTWRHAAEGAAGSRNRAVRVGEGRVWCPPRLLRAEALATARLRHSGVQAPPTPRPGAESAFTPPGAPAAGRCRKFVILGLPPNFRPPFADIWLTTTLQTPSTGLHAAPLPSLSSVPSLWHPLHAPQLPGTLFTHCPSQSLLTSPRPQRPVFPPSEPLLTPVAAPAFPPPAAPCPRSTPHRPRGLVDLLSAPPQATRLPPGHGAPPQQPPPASYPRCPLRCPHSSAPARCRQRPERGSVPDSLPAGCPGRAPYLGLRVRDERLAPGKTAGRRTWRHAAEGAAGSRNRAVRVGEGRVWCPPRLLRAEALATARLRHSGVQAPPTPRPGAESAFTPPGAPAAGRCRKFVILGLPPNFRPPFADIWVTTVIYLVTSRSTD